MTNAIPKNDIIETSSLVPIQRGPAVKYLEIDVTKIMINKIGYPSRADNTLPFGGIILKSTDTLDATFISREHTNDNPYRLAPSLEIIMIGESSGNANSAISVLQTASTDLSGKIGTNSGNISLNAGEISTNTNTNSAQDIVISNLQITPSFKGVFVYTTDTHPITSYTNTVLRWNGEQYDTNNMHSPVINPSRLTVPAGVTRVRLTASTRWAVDGQLVKHKEMRLMKNGTLIFPFAVSAYATGHSAKKSNFSSAVMPVNTGDYFELSVYHRATRSGNMINGDCEGPCIQNDSETWFSMKIVE